jgi:hypothetical protein
MSYSPATIPPWSDDGKRTVLGECKTSASSLGLGAVTYVPFNPKTFAETKASIARGMSAAFGVVIDAEIFVNPVNGSGPTLDLTSPQQPGFCIGLNATLGEEKLISIAPAGVGCSGAPNDVTVGRRIARADVPESAAAAVAAAVAIAEPAAVAPVRPAFPDVIGADDAVDAEVDSTVGTVVQEVEVAQRHITPSKSATTATAAAAAPASASASRRSAKARATAPAAAVTSIATTTTAAAAAAADTTISSPVDSARHLRARSISEFEARVAALPDSGNTTGVPQPECAMSATGTPHLRCEWNWCACGTSSWNYTNRWHCTPDACAVFRASAGVEGGLAMDAYAFTHAFDVLYYDKNPQVAKVECGSGTAAKYEAVNASSATVETPISPLRYRFDITNSTYLAPQADKPSSFLPCACLKLGVSRLRGDEPLWASDFCFDTDCGTGMPIVGWNQKAVILVGVAIAIVSLFAIGFILKQAISARSEKALELEVTGGYASINDDGESN